MSYGGSVNELYRLMVTTSSSDVGSSFDSLVCQSVRNDVGQACGRRPGRREAQVLAVWADQENETRVIDFGPHLSRWIGLGVIDLVGQRDLLDGARIASEANKPRVKQRDVAFELVGRVLSGSTVMNSGWTAAPAAASRSIADAIACNSVGHCSEQNVKPK